MILPRSVRSLLDYFYSSYLNHNHHAAFTLIWHKMVWKIWVAKNGIIFSGMSPSIEAVVNDIKVTSWSWRLAREKGVLVCTMSGFRTLSFVFF